MPIYEVEKVVEGPGPEHLRVIGPEHSSLEAALLWAARQEPGRYLVTRNCIVLHEVQNFAQDVDPARQSASILGRLLPGGN